MFVSEPITPDPGAFDPAAMARGLASMPAAFTWRGTRYVIAECLSERKVTAPEGHRAGNEVYLRRQEFEVVLDTGQRAVIYVLRQAKPGRKRWFLYTIDE